MMHCVAEERGNTAEIFRFPTCDLICGDHDTTLCVARQGPQTTG